MEGRPAAMELTTFFTGLCGVVAMVALSITAYPAIRSVAVGLAGFRRRLVWWTVFCGVSAAPSVALGLLSNLNPFGMVCGVFAIISFYMSITSFPAIRSLADDRRDALALLIVYLTLLVVSALFCGLLLFTMMVGVFASDRSPPRVGFLDAFWSILQQGLFIHGVLVLYAIPVRWACRRWMSPHPVVRSSHQRPRRTTIDPIWWLVALGVVFAITAVLRG